MKWTNRLILLSLSIALISISAACSSSTSPGGPGQNGSMNNQPTEEELGIQTGEPAPDFTLISVEGTQYKLSNMDGKVVYIFFFGAGCPHCIENGPATESIIYQPYKGNSDFIALGLDAWNRNTSEVISFQNVTGITYPLLMNARMSLYDYYGSISYYDRSVVIGGDGTVVYKGHTYVDNDADLVADIIEEELEKL